MYKNTKASLTQSVLEMILKETFTGEQKLKNNVSATNHMKQHTNNTCIQSSAPNLLNAMTILVLYPTGCSSNVY